MTLKTYQENALNALQRYFVEFRSDENPKASLERTQEALGLSRTAYTLVSSEAGDYLRPYLCVRVPTGGGKTLIAAHSVSLAMRELLRSDSAVVFWLAPTKAIVDQTLRELRNHNSAERQAINAATSKSVKILSIDEAYSNAFDLVSDFVVIVATFATFRVDKEEGRRFFGLNGQYVHLKHALGDKLSLRDVLAKAHPIIIADEAHSARNDLAISRLLEIEPSCILEYTATPQMQTRGEKVASNILISVSASELKAENMIKLPLEVQVIDKWEIVVKAAIEKRQELEDLSAVELSTTGQYIRPLILFKAEPEGKNDSVTVDVLEAFLKENFAIPAEQIAVHTGKRKDLDGIDIMSQRCPIRYVITVAALKEGWNAPYASVFCSVANIAGGTAVEQFLGRVLRMPYAKPKSQPALAKSYAIVTSQRTSEVIKALKDNLIECGFEEQEAEKVVILRPSLPEAQAPEILPLIETTEADDYLERCFAPIQSNFNPNDISVEKKIEVIASARKEGGESLAKAVEQRVMQESEARFAQFFEVPTLAVKEQGELWDFDSEILIERSMLSEAEMIRLAEFDEKVFSVHAHGMKLEVDIDGKKLVTQTLGSIRDDLLSLSGQAATPDERALTNAVLNKLDRRNLTMIDQAKLVFFVAHAVHYCIHTRNMDPVAIRANLYDFADTVKHMLESGLGQARQHAFQELLEGDELAIGHAFRFDSDRYPCKPDKNSLNFKKHFYKKVHEMNNEELECALFIDSLDEVEMWVRNIEMQPQLAFWLQTATDRFYPDFIAKLKDGRIFAIEYKGEHIMESSDSIEKRRVGDVWAKVTGNLFAMVGRSDFKNKITDSIL